MSDDVSHRAGDDVPDRPGDGVSDNPGADGLLRALDLPRNARRGAVVGLALAAVAYLVRVLELFGPFAGTRAYPVLGPEGWFLLLAFVLAASSAMLVTTLLTLVSAYRLARDL